MNDKQAKEIMDLVEDGCLVKILSGPYINGFASIFEENDIVMIEDDVWSALPLVKYRQDEIGVFRKIELKEKFNFEHL